MKEAMVLGLGESVYFSSCRESWASRGWTVGISSRSAVAGEDRELGSVVEGKRVKTKKRRRKEAKKFGFGKSVTNDDQTKRLRG
jgi:hypothetical protein